MMELTALDRLKAQKESSAKSKGSPLAVLR
jgi:hypothetical protein